MNYLRFAAAALLLTAPAIAIAAPPTWTVDTAKSTLGFSGVQTGTRFSGKFTRYNASIAFDPAHPEMSKFVVLVDLASAVTGDKQRDTALPGADWFDVAHSPRARFASSYVAAGNLTLRGVTRPVSLPFSLQVSGNQARAKGHLQLVRTVFGVGQGAWASGQWVALEVGVDIDIVAQQAS